ncbi:hypothetical protein ANN_06665 [Periplaneta americana]|uniref:Uncharacterized protein n=1 Tax=Periplaneta americana TaxID=6978 RepID=A0ABQ8TE62_PERAM|nr:hypothetical protein ANN_06665 [Periplaneta americana]
MADTSDNELQLTPPEISAKALDVTNNLLPQKSRNMYEKLYVQFMDWRKSKSINSFSEDVLLVYFEELSPNMKSSTLCTHYSILKSTLNIKHQIDLSKYSKLNSLLKRKSEGYKGKIAKTFSPDELKTFINEAPDIKYLMIKVATIFGIMGACRRHELHQLKVDNEQFHENVILR